MGAQLSLATNCVDQCYQSAGFEPRQPAAADDAKTTLGGGKGASSIPDPPPDPAPPILTWQAVTSDALKENSVTD